MATNVRRFAAGDYIKLAPGGTDAGFGTFLAVLSRTNTNRTSFLGTRGSGDTDSYVAWIEQNPYNHLALSTWGGSTETAVDLTQANGWGIVALTKGTGTVAQRGHVCVLSGPTWTHGDGSNFADGAAATEWLIGAVYRYAYRAEADADIFCVARWATALSDATLETFTSLPAIIAAAPTNLWVLDQASTATAVTEYNGTGADQVSISGTSVVSDTIPNFAPSGNTYTKTGFGAIG